MQMRMLGDVEVSAIGLGCMPMSRPVVRVGEAPRDHGTEVPDRAQAMATMRAALEAGVTWVDTADCYGPDRDGFGHNEVLVAEALRGRPDVLIATKAGIQRDGIEWPINGSPAWIRTAVQGSLQRLGRDVIDLYQSHRPDPSVPYAETIGAFRDLYDEGLVARVGISNASPDQIREAHGILGPALISVQNQLSPHFRSSEPELEVCEELGLAFLPWSPLGGMRHARELGPEHAAFGEVAEAHGVSPHQVCLAWLLAKSPAMLPIPGASRPESIQDCAEATHVVLTDEEFARLDA